MRESAGLSRLSWLRKDVVERSAEMQNPCRLASGRGLLCKKPLDLGRERKVDLGIYERNQHEHIIKAGLKNDMLDKY
jgi:hypothetical protein